MNPRPGDKLKRPRPWASMTCIALRPDGQVEVQVGPERVIRMSVERWREIARESGGTP